MVAATLSVGAEFFLGYLYGHSLAVLVLVAAWVGFWVIADSAIYKAGLTEMVLPRIRSTSLGIQSVAGFFVTIISPMVFGKILEYYNDPWPPRRQESGAQPSWPWVWEGQLLPWLPGFSAGRNRPNDGRGEKII